MFFKSWCADWCESLLSLKWLARAGSSHPRFTKANWLVEAAEGGKDLIIAIMQALCGTGEDGLVAMLTYQYVSKQSGGWSNKDTCAPFLRSCAAARVIIMSEVSSEPIIIATPKPLCEQRGALVAASGLYEGGHGFRPMANP